MSRDLFTIFFKREQLQAICLLVFLRIKCLVRMFDPVSILCTFTENSLAMKITAVLLLTFCSIASFAQVNVTSDSTKSTEVSQNRDRPFKGITFANWNYFVKGTEPLYVVDGQVTTAKDLEEIDGNKIESISVLRDGAAESIYGDKARHGVVVINMKKKSLTPSKN
jgi:TonB-dependent SusC/RagA subfamily outer membrane receptor